MKDTRRGLGMTPGAYATRRAVVIGAWVLVPLLSTCEAPAWAQQAGVRGELRIGTSGAIAEERPGGNEKGAVETLRDFIKEETGFNNEILLQKDWRELADKMAKKELDVGVFPGFEFAWAREKYPALKPLAAAVNVRPYRTYYLIVRMEGPASDFAGLAGQTLAMPKTNRQEPRLFMEKLCHENGKDFKQFFGKIAAPANAEDALDDVVDKVVQATVVDRVALEAFKRRKPGRFSQLKQLKTSRQFPTTVVAYFDKALDQPTLDRFRDGLLGASKKERGKELLTMFKLTAFEPIPDDFDKMLAETRKEYPPANNGAK